MGKKGADLTGQRFGKLTVVNFAKTGPNYTKFWLCRCDCGGEKEVRTGELHQGKTTSCGCLRGGHNRKDLGGQTFGRLTAIQMAPSRPQYGTTVGYWLCRCECGNELEVPTGNLTSGNSKSCGCLSQDSKNMNERAQTHGHSTRGNFSRTYKTWMAMLARTRNLHHDRYGGRGITVDSRWESFENFLVDMGERPEGKTLDRIDNDGPYIISNCRWATPIEQGNNRSTTTRLVTYQGRTQPIGLWARELGMPRRVLHSRLFYYGWSPERAFTEPVHRR